MENILKSLTWVFTIVALVLFWLSIRSEDNQMMYTIAALIAWLLGQGAHYWFKKSKKQGDE